LICMATFCQATEADRAYTDAYDGWHLGVQAWSFNRFTFFEAVDKSASLGLDWIEAYPGQRLFKDSDEMLIHTMSAETKEKVLEKLKDSGIRLVNYGVVELSNNEKKCREVFDFAKDMGITTIVSEPPENAFDMLDKLAQEYKINIAIHNHPKPSHYWDPNTVLKVCEGRSNYIGACCDTGHWMRSGIDPLEAVRKLKGRIKSLHLKDLNEFGNGAAYDVPWGTGIANIKAILDELHKQQFKGVFSIEYEHNWMESLPEIALCVEYFNKTAWKINPSGFADLFGKDLSNAIYPKDVWFFKDGILTASEDEFIWSKEQYKNFILDLEFKIDQGANSGVFLRCSDRVNWINTGIEVQVLDSYGKASPDRLDCGAIYDCLAPSENTVRQAGQWNHYRILCRDNKISIVLNSRKIIDMNLDQWTQAHKNPDGSENKFNIAYKDLPRTGHMGLQGLHQGKPVYYRNIKFKSLD